MYPLVIYPLAPSVNALDQYCELMGVKSPSELPTNYAIKDSESEDEDNIIQAKVYMVRNEDKRDNEENKLLIPTSSNILQLPHLIHPRLDMRNFSCQELNDCVNYKEALDAYARNADPFPYLMPAHWQDFHRRFVEATNDNSHVTNHQNPPFILNIPSNNVFMPAQTLDTITHAIGQHSPSIPTGPHVVTCYIQRPEPAPTWHPYGNRNRSRGGPTHYGNRNRGRGGFTNWRARHMNKAPTVDPRRRDHFMIMDSLALIMVPVPNTLEPIIKPAVVHQEPIVEANNLAFLNEFTNVDIASNIGDNIIMSGSVSATEGENDI